MKSQNATIQMKAIEQYFAVVLFISCCTIWFKILSLWLKSWSVTIQMKATEQYFPVVLFILLYNLVQTFESVAEILKCDHSNESYRTVLSSRADFFSVYCDR